MPNETIAFKTEINQLLDILVHSLYTEREIFLRELLSNASDALYRFKLESLTQGEVADPAAELGIWLEPDAESFRLGSLRVPEPDSGTAGWTLSTEIRDWPDARLQADLADSEIGELQTVTTLPNNQPGPPVSVASR